MDRCTGHCCRRFSLPFSPEEWKASYEQELRIQSGELKENPDPNGPPWPLPRPVDVMIVAQMIIPLGAHNWSPQTGKPYADDGQGDRLGHHYTCKHLDDATGNCRIYETRPEVCRKYPYGRPCGYTECTWDAARAGHVNENGQEMTMQELAEKAAKAAELNAQMQVVEAMLKESAP